MEGQESHRSAYGAGGSYVSTVFIWIESIADRVRSEELEVRSGGGGAQFIKHRGILKDCQIL